MASRRPSRPDANAQAKVRKIMTRLLGILGAFAAVRNDVGGDAAAGLCRRRHRIDGCARPHRNAGEDRRQGLPGRTGRSSRPCPGHAAARRLQSARLHAAQDRRLRDRRSPTTTRRSSCGRTSRPRANISANSMSRPAISTRPRNSWLRCSSFVRPAARNSRTCKQAINAKATR